MALPCSLPPCWDGQGEKLVLALTPMGEHFSTNFSSWDLAVPGSPSISRLISPRRVSPSGSLGEDGHMGKARIYQGLGLTQAGHDDGLAGSRSPPTYHRPQSRQGLWAETTFILHCVPSPRPW